MSSERRLSRVNASVDVGMAPGAESSARASPLCERWAEGLPRSNRSFQEFSRLTRVLVLYLAGPLAGLDRVECQPETVVRPVIFYWPRKLGELTGLTAKARSPAVDPFVDIGLPTNNFTVIYSFRWELGTVAGSVAWIVFALMVRWFIIWCFERAGSLPLLVAASSVAAMVVRTPWSNAFFDGTILVWILLLGLISAASDLIWPRNKHASRTQRTAGKDPTWR